MESKTILASCYAINPYKGSEDGMGWNFINQIALYNKVIAVTRENNRPAIEKYMAENPEDQYKNIKILYYDLPYWMRFWKKGSRGAMLYYLLWQKGIVSFIKKHKSLKYDIVHNLNFHNDWTPSYLWKLRKPMVWGPIGHHPLIPKQYLEPYSKSYLIKDRLTWMVKKFFWKYSFSLKRTIKRSDYIFCMNSGVYRMLNLKDNNSSIMPSVATEDFYTEKPTPKEKFKIISVGRFVPLKGFDLTILAFARIIKLLSQEELNRIQLVLVGAGPELPYYKKLIEEKKITEYVQIIEWIDRKDLMKLYQESSVFLFPSHEGAGMVVAEALSFGLPVVCLANEGPGEFINQECGFAIKHQDIKATEYKLSKAVLKLFNDQDLYDNMSKAARAHYLKKFSWKSRGLSLKAVYSNISIR